MHMFGRKKKVKGDEATQMLIQQGVYHPNAMYDHPYHMDSKAIKKKKVYGFWAGVKYTVILSVLLFWIPPFGQMIAGYVGGRKAGSPVKGFFATLIPVFFVFVIYALVWALSAALAAIAGVLVAPVSLLEPVMGFIGVKAFAAAIVGGFGSLPGAILGGLIVGIVEQFAGLYLPAGFADTSAYAILLLMLFVRPEGIFATMQKKKV